MRSFDTNQLFRHIVMGSGESSLHRLDVGDFDEVRAAALMLPHGGKLWLHAPFSLQILTPLFQITRGREPVVTCALGTGSADPCWEVMAGLQARFSPCLASPPAGRWLATVELPGHAFLAKDDAKWLKQFLPVLGAAILTSDRQRHGSF